MNRFISMLVTVLWLCSGVAYAEEIPASVKALVPKLQEWGRNPVLVTAVKEQNNLGMDLTTIRAKDEVWIATEGLNDDMKALMSSNAARTLLELERSAPYFLELFLMDNQGANVAMTNKTSDYWQGDEEKFTESFAHGKGAVYIGDVTFDKSAQAYLVQVSVPVMDAGHAIGALTVGINLDELDK